MGFAWLNPLYFAGLLLLALPLLIHLVQRHQPSGLRFPSLMFLRQIPFKQRRRLEIRHWLLLLLRCLLLLLLIVAFARPFLRDRAEPAAAAETRSDGVIVLDRSYSMRLGNRWPQARARALELIAARAAPDRIGIIAFDDETEVLSDLSADGPALRALIERQAPGFRATRPRVAIEQAARLLESSDAARKRIYLVSDFNAAPTASPRIGADIEFVALPVEVETADNAAIAGFSIGPSARGSADEFTLDVEVTNHGGGAREQGLRLLLDGREVAQRRLSLPPGATVSATFADLAVAGGLARGEIRLGDDALALDNSAYFVFSNRQKVPVLLIDEAGARANQLLYVENALRLSRRPLYRVQRAAWADLAAEDLARWAIIVVNDVSLPGGALGDALRAFVAAGGGLLVASGERLQGRWPGGADGYLPGRLLRQVESAPGRAHQIGAIDGGHPLAGVDLSGARVFTYREIETGPGDRVLARYEDASPALLERRLGGGTALVLSTTLDAHWNDLPLRPNYLPFVLRGMEYLAAVEPYPSSVEVGAVVDVMRYARALAGADAIVAAAGDSLLTIERPGARELRLERQSALLPIREPGFYQVHRATPAGVDVVIAANVDPAEAAPMPLDVTRFVSDIRASAAPPAGDFMTRRQAAEREAQQQLWYIILAVALLLMLIEAFAANWTAVRRDNGARTV